jgi:hypothetical protein
MAGEQSEELLSDVEGKGEIRVFLSHRTADKPIADVVFEALADCGIAKRNIFYSSTTDKGKRPTIGEFLASEIAQNLHDASLFILVYTLSDEDWSWSMWEFGLTLDSNYLARKHKFDTKVVIFQCTQDEPKVAEDVLRVKLDQRSIENFVSDLCTKDNFVPGCPAPAPNMAEGVIHREAKRFYTNLKQKVEGSLTSSSCRDVWRWDWFKLRLPALNMEIFHNASDEEKIAMVVSEAMLVAGYGSALRHFNYAPPRTFEPSGMFTVDEPTSFMELIGKWKRSKRVADSEMPGWGSEIALEIIRSLNDDPASPQRELMKSANEYLDDWYYPVVNHVSQLGDGSLDIFIYMYRLAHDFPWLTNDGVGNSTGS